MSRLILVFVTLGCLCNYTVNAQRYGDGNYNRLGIQAGYAIFDISTTDLTTQAGTSFTGGFTTRGSFRNNFDVIYGINFMSSSIAVKSTNPCTVVPCAEAPFIDYTIIGAQLNLLASYHIIKHHLSIEAGPMLYVNGKMKLDNEQDGAAIIDGYTTLKASDLENINTINGAALIGITGGFKTFKAFANYQYGFTNILGGLNDQGLENTNFKGTTSLIVLGGVIYF